VTGQGVSTSRASVLFASAAGAVGVSR